MIGPPTQVGDYFAIIIIMLKKPLKTWVVCISQGAAMLTSVVMGPTPASHRTTYVPTLMVIISQNRTNHH